MWNLGMKRNSKILDISWVFDIFKPNYDEISKKNDYFAVKSDWQKVGNDIKWSIEHTKIQ